MRPVRIGCSGWQYDSWRGRLYPEGLAKGRWLGRYYEAIEPLVQSGKLGPVVWQFPANFKCDLDRLGGALPLLPPGRHCFEFRHESWFTEPVYKLLRAHGAALVIGDH